MYEWESHNNAATFWKFPHDCTTNYSQLYNNLFNDVITDENIESIELWHQEVSDYISNDPAAIVIICNRISEAFHEYLFNIPKEKRKLYQIFLITHLVYLVEVKLGLVLLK